MIRPYRCAERVSNYNTGTEYGYHKQQLRRETKIVTKELFGKEIDPVPIAMKFDCAMELVNGAIQGYRIEGQIDTGKMYTNIVILILLRHEHKTSGVNEESVLKDCARVTLDRIRSTCVCVCKQCNSHVYLAMRDQRKNMKNPPPEMRLYKDQIDHINRYLARTLTKLPRVVDVISRISVVMALYEIETIQCEPFDMNSPTQEHHDGAMSETAATRLHAVIEDEIARMLIDDDETMQSLIDVELNEIGTAEAEQRFKVHQIARRVVDRIKNDVPLAFPYLHSIDRVRNQGTINICYIFSCYDIDENEVETIAPQRTGGFSVTVDLPMTSGRIPSPIRSERGSDYWMYWVNRAPLWALASVNITETALDARIFPNNQGLEGSINQQKTHTSTVKEDMHELSAIIHRRWNDTFESGRLLRKQLKDAGRVIRRRKGRAIKKAGGKESNMKWKKKSRSPKAKLEKWKKDLDTALAAAQAMGKADYRDKSIASKWRVLRDYAVTRDASFMGKPSFTRWYSGKRELALQSHAVEVLKSFCATYATSNVDDNSSCGNEMENEGGIEMENEEEGSDSETEPGNEKNESYYVV